MSDSNTKTILIIEDEEDIRVVVASFLEDAGYKVQTAENGSVALDLLKECALPDMILLDSFMPVMDGKRFALQFHETLDPDKKTPVVIMSAAPNVEQQISIFGARTWIGKPFTLKELLALIQTFET